jgi:ketosteroid isomerase-like protein
MVTGERRTSNEDNIRALIETWARAVSAGNRKALLAHHSPDLVHDPIAWATRFHRQLASANG